MVKTKQSTLTAKGDRATLMCVVHKGNDGIWLNFNPKLRDGAKGESTQKGRVFSVRSMRPGKSMGKWSVNDQCCEVRYLKPSKGRFDIAVMNSGNGMNPDNARSFLLSAQGNLHGGFGYGGLSVHVHAPLIERIGEMAAVEAARKWAKEWMLGLPAACDIVGCERTSRIDYAVDVLVEKDGPDDYGPAVHEQLISRLQNRQSFYNTGWEIGRGNADKDRLGLVIVSYDKFKERWDKGGFAGLREYVESLSEPGLVVHRDGRVTDADGNEMRCWRVEFRFHRCFLKANGIDNADEAIAALPALVAAASRDTRLLQRCATGNVFRTNPVTPLWSLAQEAVT